MSATPLLTREVHDVLQAAARIGNATLECSLDLSRSMTTVALDAAGFTADGRHHPWIDQPRERTIYQREGEGWAPVQRYSTALIKLVPTDWGPPTFEIDGIKMLPTAQVSPWADAQRKVALIAPRGKTILDCCGGLGYFAACCIAEGAARVQSYEKNPDVIWLRGLNPWSPQADGVLTLEHADISTAITALPDAAFDAVLHDPPRFGIAGELYSRQFYDQLARVLRRRGRLFHYTGTPNKLTSGRDVPGEVLRRLQRAGFTARREGDGVLAVKN
ncbi:MAG: SAM-dependent methyltransferase [Betaproteobacteria bacterium]|nr:SAM-dependent methyltransferase [Betaproteobacteria bacterium]